MATGEITDMAVAMLGAEMVEGILTTAFQHRPEGFDPVRVDNLSHIFANGIIRGFVIETFHALTSFGVFPAAPNSKSSPLERQELRQHQSTSHP
ncbi:MAG: hypothetical protein OXC93_17175 [Rhodospirillaceae bacterium]|nr:hypothetical protein [Rhodospirillaceae bacterium]